VVLIVVFGISLPHSQAEQRSASLFGVRLDEKVSALVEEVEHLYGRSIRTELLPDEDPMPGRSRVGEDGTPIISINPRSGRQPDVIAHELYHFLLRARGYPVIQWLYPRAMDTGENQAAFRHHGFQLYDPILHLVFYAEARARLGIDPGHTVERLNRQALSDISISTKLTEMDAEAIALAYYIFRLESEDTMLLEQFVALLESHGKRNQAAVGERLATIVEWARPLSPESAVSALVECLNVFYEGRYVFEQRPLKQRQLGLHIQHIAPVELKLVRPATSPVPKEKGTKDR
jgi:hypothetical protein